MAATIIRVENLSKQYRLGEIGTGALSHDLKRWWYQLRGKPDPFAKIGEVNDRTTKAASDYVWALQDINFDVKQGEVLGIIGKNGAGKSTLLKILSKTTTPTTGSVKIKGRIASLLEVGTGFHPELSGRENIFLNGAILGMTKREIKAKFDEIVDFSGVERYIDTPVKRYSSGMYVRLAFAVAAHLEPEILIVDEVLAVGDAEFQKKCLGKMNDVSVNEGRTVLFVSHNMAAIKTLCDKAMHIEKGEIVYYGKTEKAIQNYLGNSGTLFSNFRKYAIGLSGYFLLDSISIINSARGLNDPIDESLDIELYTRIKILSNNPERYSITYHLFNDHGDALFSFGMDKAVVNFREGDNCVMVLIPKSFLQPGNYSLSFYFIEDSKSALHIESHLFYFTIVDGSREVGVYMGREPGFIRPQFKWEISNFFSND